MFRLTGSALAALLTLVLAATAAAQPSPAAVCGGQFERFLKGHIFIGSELEDFLGNADAVARCRAALDPTRPEHQLIDVVLERSRALGDEGSDRNFAAACARGIRLACLYAPANGPPLSRMSLAEARAHLRGLLDTNYTAVAVALAVNLMRDTGNAESLAEALRLLRLASERGDWWGGFLLAEHEKRSAPDAAPSAWLAKAAEQGNVAAAINLAGQHRARREPEQALRWYRHAAEGDTRWFRSYVARARSTLGTLYATGNGVPRDPAQARQWFESAAALGDENAKRELEKLK